MRLRNILSFLLLAAIVALGALYIVRHREEFRLMTHLVPGPVAGMLLMKVCGAGILAWQLQIVLKAYGVRPGFAQCFGLSRMSVFAGLFLPFPGPASLKAVYLKKFHDLRYGSFLAGTSIAAIIKLMVASFLAMLWLLLYGRDQHLLLLVSSLMLAASTGFLVFAHRLPAGWFAWWGRLASLAAEWRTVRTGPGVVFGIALASAIGSLLNAGTIWFAFRSFGVEAGFAPCGVIAVFLMFLGTLRLLPGDIGTREVLISVLSGMFGIGVNEGLHAAALYRIGETVVALIMAPVFMGSLRKT